MSALTVKVAILDSRQQRPFSDYERHFANIRETLLDLMTKARAELGTTILPDDHRFRQYVHLQCHSYSFVQEVISFPVHLALHQRQMLPLKHEVKMRIIYF